MRDSVKRMEIMGVSTVVDANGNSTSLPHTLPFLKLYHTWRIAQDRQAEAIVLADTAFDFEKTVLLRQSPVQFEGRGSADDSVSLVKYSENELSITAYSSSSSVLFVNDLYYPAWQASVDGKITNIIRAFSSLRAIPLPPGKHRVELEYRSTAFELGWKITLATLISSICALIFGSRKNRQKVRRLATNQHPLNA